MKFEIKNLKHSEFASQETHCFEATLYKDGKRFCIVKNAGHGGPNDYNTIGSMEHKALRKELAVIDKKLGKEILPSEYLENGLHNCLEIVVGDLVNNALVDKTVKAALRRITYINKDGSVYQLPAKHKPTEKNLEAVQNAEWWKEGNKILNGQPIEEIRHYLVS